jgi:oxygen-dependent protoporphyrinogen oxidase
VSESVSKRAVSGTVSKRAGSGTVPKRAVSGTVPDRVGVVVVGGGISGLAAAWELTGGGLPDPDGPSVTVLEASPRLGGKLRTEVVAGRSVDLGPDAFVARRPEARTLCEELGLGPDLMAPGKQGASVWARGRMRALPASLAVGIPTRLGPLARSGVVGPGAVIRASLDLLPSLGRRAYDSPATDEALGPLVARHLGDEVVDRLVDPLMGGIHACPVDAMSTGSVLPAALGARGRRTGLMRALRGGATPPGPSADGGTAPVFLSVRGGMGRLVDRLADALAARHVSLCTGTAVRALSASASGWTVHTDAGDLEAEAVVLAAPATAGAQLLAGVAPGAADILATVRSAAVTIVTMVFDDDGLEPTPGTGFLVPARQGLLLTGCTWMSAKWPALQRSGEVLVRASCGRFGDERAAALADDELVARVVDELHALVGATGTPRHVVVTRWPDGFPQYPVDHPARMAEVERRLRDAPAPLAAAGAYLSGVGVPACIGSGRRAGSTILDSLRSTHRGPTDTGSTKTRAASTRATRSGSTPTDLTAR